MEKQVLARSWRPQSFSEVIGQTSAVKALSNALDNGRLHHAYLLVGTRGVGKTTLARLLAKALNCEQGVSATPCGACNACLSIPRGNYADLIEIDAASKTGVDDTREILENVQYRPTSGRYKVYLIDEVHMFSKASFNALLKTLEEPPAHVKFLLATTDPQKVPITVLSRCMQLRLQRVDESLLTEHFQKIADAEAITVETKEALNLLAEAADGSVRDGLSLMDQAIALGNGAIELESVKDMLGMVSEHYVQGILQALIDGNAEAALKHANELAKVSSSFQGVLKQLLEAIHQLMLLKQLGPSASWHARVPRFNQEWVDQIQTEALHLIYDLILKGQSDFSLSPNARSAFEVLLLRVVAFRPTVVQISKKATTVEPMNVLQSQVDPSEVRFEEEVVQPKPLEEKRGGETRKPQPVEAAHSPPQEPERNAQKTAQSSNESVGQPATPTVQTIGDLNANNWSDWLLQRRSEFSTIVWQYLRNSRWEQLSENALMLGMTTAHASMCGEVQRKQIADQLSGLMGVPLTLQVRALESVQQTVHDTQQQSALDSIAQDEPFQTLKKGLDLTIDEGSIEPVNSRKNRG